MRFASQTTHLAVNGSARFPDLTSVSRSCPSPPLPPPCSYVLDRLRGLATHEFDEAVLPRAQPLVCAGPLAFLQLVLQAAGERQGMKLQVRARLVEQDSGPCRAGCRFVAQEFKVGRSGFKTCPRSSMDDCTHFVSGMLLSKWQLWVAWLLCAGPVAFLQLVLQAAGERQGMKLQVGVGSGFVDQGQGFGLAVITWDDNV